MKTFFDSSGLAKRYIKERGSEKVRRALSDASEVAVCLICPPEILSALTRLRRQGSISAAQYEVGKGALYSDIEDMAVCAITVPVVHKAIDLIEGFPLRTLDALHVASALDWRADLFVSSDRRQLAAAAESGLRVLPV
jgi:predicted nucleic acid-binding protein